MLAVHPYPSITEKPYTRILFVCEDKPLYKDGDKATLCEKIRNLPEFGGRAEKIYFLSMPEGMPSPRVILAGVGKKEDLNAESFRRAAAAAVKAAMEAKEEVMGVFLPDAEKSLLENHLVKGLLEGLVLANYRFDAYKKESEIKALQEILILTDTASLRHLTAMAAEVQAVCTATHLARSWVSIPPNDKRPQALADMLEKAAVNEGLATRRMGRKELTQLGFGAMLAVAQGSDAEPCLLTLHYNPEKAADKTVALVGKGVTFDSGGLDLKPPAGMEGMKMDMAGAAAVTGAAIALARTRPSFRFIAAIPIVENMPSATAYRPGDVFRAYNGKSIEVMNTDAEGRLILADTLAWLAEVEKPDLMIDMATLTGACMVALGEDMAGGFTEDSTLAQALAKAGEATFERCWPMPLPRDYKKLLKSELADLRNVSTTRNGGAITAALFLQEFTGKTRWAHIDIAGPAYLSKASAYCPAGGSGFGVRLLHGLLTDLEETKML
ncbi:leucyl aminopeptidase [Desulfobotulus sp. H1]|uniref:Probable cytosol aminopeptidase n=1 Tax=Desulfobotulus pelophilus TaxID=2823377 RepID=A0ABT3N9H4_9BACT|nr:leucyl aminopeptidase [Desulfobotulus pelophilus]MCW7754105.1 leucyl aminopeptidase [Desulfobotulus pelophilus]